MGHRDHLPQLDGGTFLTDGGLETCLIFDEGIDLPEFAAFPLLDDDAGERTLRRYYERYLTLAQEHGTGFVLESPTWRASRVWGARLGYDDAALNAVNRQAITLMAELRDAWQTPELPVVISGSIGPQDDAYDPHDHLSADQAQAYHAAQVQSFVATQADLVTAMTLSYADEAVGIARAAAAAGMPVALSFTVETDGRLPSGQALGEAIEQVDAQTGGESAYFMLNCAHPTHFAAVLEPDAPWLERIVALRANASTRSHAELDEAEALDGGDPEDLGARYAALAPLLRRLTVVGGCCGTDFRHVEAIARAWPGAQAAYGLGSA